MPEELKSLKLSKEEIKKITEINPALGQILSPVGDPGDKSWFLQVGFNKDGKSDVAIINPISKVGKDTIKTIDKDILNNIGKNGIFKPK
ncbi:hypothetical protein [Metabacillus rhizolycopersici]|uniref:Uncharacterized protein n=1 Tax=Metabacillus rhizolycopersici TaxID=2875709 RepID=A0ABS7UYF7_9BACI|nr:hypothetical protein [Metabacillus rhizolycopersici]MBZ5753358.1 hypothetical protein [Metabacillus rhizolycopersici]